MVLKTLSNSVNPLSYDVPIVTTKGTPTPEFQRKWAQQQATNANIPNLTTAAAISAVLDYLATAEGSLLVRGAAAWAGLGPGAANTVLASNGTGALPSWDTVSALLDTLGSAAEGDVLVRGASAWSLLAAGTSTDVLTSNGPGALPSWQAGGGGGGTPANPTATAGPTAVNGSATTYMRSDAAPAVQKASASQFGIVEVDGTTITAASGVISAVQNLLVGSGAPSLLEPAGTIYSRSDAARDYSSQPITNGVVQHKSYVEASGTPGSVNLTSAPGVGNLVLAFISWGDNNAAIPTINTSKWTTLFSVPGTGGDTVAFCLYRYAQAGDTSALPAFCTAGSAYWAVALYEISGVSGTIATDVPLYEGSYASASPITTSAQVTTVANQIAIVAGGQYDGNVNPSLSSGWTLDEAQNNSGNFGSVYGGHQGVASSGTSISATVTGGGAGDINAMQVIVTVSQTENWNELPLIDGTTITRSGGGILSAVAALPSMRGFSASISSSQAVSDSTYTTAIYNNLQINRAGSDYSTSTGIFTPTKAGVYLVFASLTGETAAVLSQLNVAVLKNGVVGTGTYVALNFSGNLSFATNQSPCCVAVGLFIANGSTDNVRVQGYVAGTGGSDEFLGSNAYSFFGATYLGP